MFELLLERLEENRDKTFLINKSGSFTYNDLLVNINNWIDNLKAVEPDSIVVHKGSYEIENISLLITLGLKKCVAVPVSSNEAEMRNIFKITEADYYIDCTNNNGTPEKIAEHQHSFDSTSSGIVFFTSGSSGNPKAALHDFRELIRKFTKSRKAFKTCTVLLFDHMAGFDNLFYVLFGGGSLIIPEELYPSSVIKAIKEHKAELLTATPSFINFLLLNGQAFQVACQEMKMIVFSSEKMPESTLRRFREIIPKHIQLIQKYGSTEMGSPSSRTNPDNPQLISFDQKQTPYKIVKNILYLKKSNSFKGYLNYGTADIENDWYCTGDIVEQAGEWLHIQGRETDLINVGGRKVLPQEVESILLMMNEVLDVTVTGKKHKLMGQVVQAELVLKEFISKQQFLIRMRRFCKNKIAAYKIPVYIELIKESKLGNRLKKVRVEK